MDQHELDAICDAHKLDDGMPYSGSVEGCYKPPTRVSIGDDGKAKTDAKIYLRDDCTGAKALVHELAHHYGISDPGKDGFDW